MSVYTGPIATAQRLIDKFGRTASIIKRDTESPTGEEREDDTTKEIETTVTGKAVFFDEILGQLPSDLGDDRLWIGTILIAATTAGTNDLTEFDLIRDSGRHIELASIAPLKPGPEVVIYIATKDGG